MNYTPINTATGQNNTGATGLIVDADTLLPLENVTVDAYYGLSYSGPAKVTVQTDDTGQFTLMGITESPVNFIFSLSGYSSSAANLTVEPFTIGDLGEIQLQQLANQAPIPDLVVNNVDNATTFNDPVTLALSGFISSEISNTGTATADAGIQIIAFYDSNQNQTYDPISDQLLGQVQTASQIQPNEKQQLSIPVQGILPYRDALIHVWIDSTQSVIESDESNNLLSSAAICNQKTFTPQAPPPNITVAPGYSLELYATKVINQQGPIQLAMDSADNLYFAPGDSGGAYVFPKGTPGPASQRKPKHFGDTRTTDTDGVVVDSQDNVIVSGNRILKFAPDESLIWSRTCPAGNIQLSGIDQNDAIYVGSLGSTFCKFSANGDRQILGPFPTPHSPNFAPDGTLYLIGVRPPNIAIVDPDTGATLDFFLVNFRANQLAFDCDGFIYTSQINDPSGIRHIYKIDPITKQFTSLASGAGLTNPSGFVFDSEGNLFIADQTTKKIYKLTFADSSCRPDNIDLTASKLELNGILSNSNTFSALIGNAGEAASPTTIARLYEGDPATGGIQVGTLTIPSIAADSSLQITFNTISLAGGQDLYVSIDDDQQITECREDNNIARLAAPDLKPDLIVSAYDTASLTTDLFNLTVMGSLDATITNQGSFASLSAATVLAFYDKDKNGIFDATNDISLGQVDILNSLQIGESQTVVIPINGTSPFRDAPITLWVDHLLQITELDENNNTQITRSQCLASSGQVSSDLTVSLAQIIDNGSLQPWSFSVRIANAGTLSTPDQIKVSFYEGLPSQGGDLLGSKNIAAIHPGNFINLQLDGITHFNNTAELYVIADENNQLDECDETNNTLLGAISAASRAQIGVSTDQPSYPAKSPVIFQSIVTNAGSATAQFSAQLELEDSTGVIIQQFASIQTGTLTGGASFRFNQAWNTQTFLTGTYQLRGSVYATDGSLLDQSSTTFTLVGASGSTLEASLRTTTDQAQYHTTATVQLQNLAQNLTLNRIIEQADLHISVTNPAGLRVFSQTVKLGQLLPGATPQIIRPFSFIGAPVGAYTVKGLLTDTSNQQTLATDQAQYTVTENLLFSIIGKTRVQFPQLERGQTNHCIDTVINQGTQNLSNLPIRKLLAKITDFTPLLSHQLTIDLDAKITQISQRQIDTRNFDAGIYVCILQAQVNNQWQTLANATFTVTVPPIDIISELIPGTKGRLLVLLDSPQDDKEESHCDDNDDDDNDEKEYHDREYPHKQAKSKVKHNGEKEEKEEKEEDKDEREEKCNQNGENNNASQPSSKAQELAYLQTLLTDNHWSYRIVTDAKNFKRELRTGNYTLYALFSGQIKLKTQIQQELREAIFQGDGLLLAGDHDHRNNKLNTALGIEIEGVLNYFSGFDLFSPNFPLNGIVQDTFSEKPLKAALNGAQALAYYLNTYEDVALSQHRFGLGRSLYAGFDLLALASQTHADPLFEAIILTALQQITPTQADTQEGSPVSIQLNLKNQGIATPGQAIITIPANITLLDTGTAQLNTQNNLLWAFDLAESESTSLSFWLQRPALVEHFTINSLIQTGIAPNFHDLNTQTLNLTVTPAPSLQEVLDMPEIQNKAYKKIRKKIKKAQRQLNRNKLKKALNNAIKASNIFERTNHPNADIIRLQLDKAIRAIARHVGEQR